MSTREKKRTNERTKRKNCRAVVKMQHRVGQRKEPSKKEKKSKSSYSIFFLLGGKKKRRMREYTACSV